MRNMICGTDEKDEESAGLLVVDGAVTNGPTEGTAFGIQLLEGDPPKLALTNLDPATVVVFIPATALKKEKKSVFELLKERKIKEKRLTLRIQSIQLIQK